MPDRRTHRGAHPQDGVLFAPEKQPRLNAAVQDLSWLLSRGYKTDSALQLVGNRHALNKRQRTAISRAACADEERRSRCEKETSALAPGTAILIDGYNLLTTVEAALGGGIILLCRDGCLRDLACMRGTYRRVVETDPALDLIAGAIEDLKAGAGVFYLDRPVSNSGRLKQQILERMAGRRFRCEVELVKDPDRVLVGLPETIVTADSWILNRCGPWLNLARRIIRAGVPTARVVALDGR